MYVTQFPQWRYLSKNSSTFREVVDSVVKGDINSFTGYVGSISSTQLCDINKVFSRGFMAVHDSGPD